jgi:hypothetical protein
MKNNPANVVIADAVITPDMLTVIRTWQTCPTQQLGDEPVSWFMESLETVTDCIIDPERISDMTEKQRIELLYYIRSLKKEIGTFIIFAK